MGSLLGVWLTLAGPATPAPSTPDVSEATAEAPETPVSEALRLDWRAGGEPVSVQRFSEALDARLPAGRFEPASPDTPPEVVWVVEVSQPEAGVYRLEVAPPGRAPLACRVELDDPAETRRTLALLTLFALEYGEFPPLREGVRAEPAEPEPAPDPKPPPEAVPPEPQPPPRPEPRTQPEPSPERGLVVHVGLGPWLATATRREPGTVAPGIGALADAGAQLGRWAWVGAEGSYSGHLSAGIDAHRLAGTAFGGIRPRVGKTRIGGRLGVGGGVVHGRGEGESATRPFFAGSLGLGLDAPIVPKLGLILGFIVTAELASRSSSFVGTEDAVGVGAFRGGLAVVLGFDRTMRRDG